MIHCRFDLHCHTHYSEDGISSPEKVIAAAKHKGLNALAITDHNTFDALEYLEAVGLFDPSGHAIDGFLVVPGVEVTTAEGHLLCLGMLFPEAKEFKGAPAIEVCSWVQKRGGLAIPAHPYDRFRAGIRESVLDKLNLDALEVFNAASTFKRYNDEAFAYAERRGLPMVAASDAHHAKAVATSFCSADLPALTLPSLMDAIKQGPTMHRVYLSAKESFKKTWANLLRIGKRPPSFIGKRDPLLTD